MNCYRFLHAIHREWIVLMNLGEQWKALGADIYDFSVRTIGLTWTGKCGGQTWAVTGLAGLDFFV